MRGIKYLDYYKGLIKGYTFALLIPGKALNLKNP